MTHRSKVCHAPSLFGVQITLVPMRCVTAIKLRIVGNASSQAPALVFIHNAVQASSIGRPDCRRRACRARLDTRALQVSSFSQATGLEVKSCTCEAPKARTARPTQMYPPRVPKLRGLCLSAKHLCIKTRAGAWEPA